MLRRLFLAIVVLAVIAAGLGLWARQRMNAPYRQFAGEEVFVEIPTGSSVASIANRLVAAGVIPDPWTFRLTARLSGSDRRLQAGEYRFAGESTPLAVMEKLATGDVYSRSVTFPEGLTVAEMAEIFAKTGLGGPRDFVLAANDSARVAATGENLRSLEGYLFPDTYPLPREASADDVVGAMLERFDRVMTPARRAAAAERGMSVHEVLTLASLVEKETSKAEERPIVAGVYLNRLKIRMPLQCDPTVIYAMMLSRKWNGNIRKADLQITSPYNTYRVAGLPPGPIASPGLASIDAVLHPADVPYLYFVSRNDGTHVFAKSLAEHNRNVREYQQKRRP